MLKFAAIRRVGVIWTYACACPVLQVVFQVSERERLVSLRFNLFEDSAAPTPQRAIEQVPVAVPVQKDILSEFITCLFASSCLLIALDSIGQVKFLLPRRRRYFQV